VGVDAQGDVLAAWPSLQTEPSGTQVAHAEVALAPAGGEFGAPTSLGEESYGDYPAITTSGAGSTLVWIDADGNLLASPVTP
jgi:hypothetical protein